MTNKQVLAHRVSSLEVAHRVIHDGTHRRRNRRDFGARGTVRKVIARHGNVIEGAKRHQLIAAAGLRHMNDHEKLHNER
jgi:hypothetical protein